MLDKLISEIKLTPEQVAWLSLPENKEEIPFIATIWEENADYEPGETALAIKISLDAGRQQFFEQWDESIIDKILTTYLPPDSIPHLEIYKQYLQLQMLLEKQENSDLSLFRLFLMGNLEVVPWVEDDLANLSPIDGEMVYDVADGSTQKFTKGWKDGSLMQVTLGSENK